MRVRIDNQLRGVLKVIGKCGHGQIGQPALELAEGNLALMVLSPPW
jgi:hypothetical protein